MTALQFWKTVTKDESGFLEAFLSVLEGNKIRFCVIGGQGVNAYVDPLVSLDLDIVVAVDQLPLLEQLIAGRFEIEWFPYTLNIRQPGSSLAVQVQTDPRYFDFPGRSVDREVLGMTLPVATIEDVLQGKVWAASQETRRPSKRRKDLLDIERLIESYPHLRERVPEAILARLGE
jgi:hypothetical protein